MPNNKKRPEERPGDFLLDRYFPDASPEEREEAREDFTRFVAVLLDIATAIAEREAAEVQHPS